MSQVQRARIHDLETFIHLGSACAAVKADHGLVVGAKVACQSG